MPVLNLEQLDDPILPDACPGFLLGQNSFLPPDQLQQTEAAQLVNIDIRDATATTRRGTMALGTKRAGAIRGLCWYQTPALQYLVAAANAGLWKWDGTSWTGMSAYAAVSASAQITFAQIVATLYIADGSSHLFSWDGSSLVDLGTGSSAQPPVGSILLAAQNRLWLAGVAAVPDGLYTSTILDGATWDTTNNMIRIGSGAGDPITGLCEWDDNNIVVFTRNAIYLLQADPATTAGGETKPLGNASITKISETIGCVSHRSIARVGSDVWFLSDAGVFSVGRVIAQTQREVKQASSLPIQDLTDRINFAAGPIMAGFYWDNRYFLSVPLDDETANSTVLVYSTLRQGWSGMWTTWAPQCWALSKPGGQERIDFGRADGNVWRWLDYVAVSDEAEPETFTDGDGSDIATSPTTRGMIFTDAICPKSALNVSVEFFASEAVATIEAILDQGDPITLLSNVSTSLGELLLNFTLPATLPGTGIKRRACSAQHLEPFRSMQIRVSSTAGKLGVRAITATAFLDTLQIEQ